jgi:hypothetical protein
LLRRRARANKQSATGARVFEFAQLLSHDSLGAPRFQILIFLLFSRSLNPSCSANLCFADGRRNFTIASRHLFRRQKKPKARLRAFFLHFEPTNKFSAWFCISPFFPLLCGTQKIQFRALKALDIYRATTDKRGFFSFFALNVPRGS